MKKFRLTWETRKTNETKVEYCFRHCELNIESNSRCVNNDVRVY